MAKIPNWDYKVPAFAVETAWVRTTPRNGYFVTNRTSYAPLSISSGFRNYRDTPGYNSPNRPEYVPPLGYEAGFKEASAHSYLRSFSANPTPEGMDVLEDSTQFSTNVVQMSQLSRPDDVSVSAMKQKSILKLLDKLKDSSINVAQAFAEREMTVKTVTSAAKSIAGTISALRRGSYSDAAKALGLAKPKKRAGRRFKREFEASPDSAFANAWLSLQYGWKPLLDDAYGACEQLAKAKMSGENPNTIYFIASGKGFKGYERYRKVSLPNPQFWSGTDLQIQYCTGSILVRTQVRYSKTSKTLSSLASVGITNPALLAWELMPYSFVIDWFLPIGNWLGSLDATSGLTFQSGFTSTLVKANGYNVWNTDQQKPGGYFSRAYLDQWKNDSMDRTRMGSFPSASFPRFKNPASFSHMTSALSLLRQLKR